MQVVICDDLEAERKQLKGYLRRLEEENNLELDILEFTSGEALVSYFEKNPKG